LEEWLFREPTVLAAGACLMHWPQALTGECAGHGRLRFFSGANACPEKKPIGSLKSSMTRQIHLPVKLKKAFF
jgi:hypothetical protein